MTVKELRACAQASEMCAGVNGQDEACVRLNQSARLDRRTRSTRRADAGDNKVPLGPKEARGPEDLRGDSEEQSQMRGASEGPEVVPARS